MEGIPMKLNIEKVIQPLDLGDYAEAMKGQILQIWVNPPMAIIRRRELLLVKYNLLLDAMKTRAKNADAAAEKTREKIAEEVGKQIDNFNSYASGEFTDGINDWFSDLWSQHHDPATHWTRQELVDLNEADPALYQWLKNQTIEAIAAHKAGEKKGSVTR